MKYDVIVVGAGPAGIFAALTLAEKKCKSVLLIEQGKELNKRKRRSGTDMLCGWAKPTEIFAHQGLCLLITGAGIVRC